VNRARQADLHQRVLLLLSTARDTELTRELLARSDIPAHVCSDSRELQHELARGAGAVMVTEETLSSSGAQAVLAQAIESQPRWSDLPVLLLTHGGANSTVVGDAVAMLNNVTLLERPLRVQALLSAVRTALRARNRQYEIQEHLRELEQAHDAEVMAVRRKDEFLAMLAHELRNPLAPISNALHVLEIDDSDPVRRATLRTMMKRQVVHMVRLVDDLLEASRLSRGMITLHRERMELCNAMRVAIEASRPQLDQGGYQLEVDLPETPLLVDADPVRIAQVFGNLLNNSVKYGRRDGCIKVTVHTDGGQAVAEVADDGLGIDRETLPHVFELFTQGARAGGDQQEGLGIGLALVRNLVELHGGTVEAHSEGRGQGARFVVRLPLASSKSAQPSTPAPGKTLSSVAPEIRVLVVDDNRDAAQSLALVMESMDLAPRVAHSGPEALRIALDYQPHLILLDIGMPGMDGYEVARRVRTGDGAGDPVIVAVTGWSHAQDLAKSRAAGFDHHLAKPADIPRLTALVDEIRSDLMSARMH